MEIGKKVSIELKCRDCGTIVGIRKIEWVLTKAGNPYKQSKKELLPRTESLGSGLFLCHTCLDKIKQENCKREEERRKYVEKERLEKERLENEKAKTQFFKSALVDIPENVLMVVMGKEWISIYEVGGAVTMSHDTLFKTNAPIEWAKSGRTVPNNGRMVKPLL